MENAAISNYRKTALDMIKLYHPELSYSFILDALDKSIEDDYKDHAAKIINNYKNTSVDTTLSKLVDYISSREPIMTSHGVMFMQHDNGVLNPIKELFKFYLADRKRLKAKMFEELENKNHEAYERYNLAQSLRKISANSIYGLTASSSSYFYNIYMAAAITRQGKSSIASAIMLFESFLGGNVELGSLDEMIEYIHNIIGEPRQYDDTLFLDKPVTVEQCWYQVMCLCGLNGYIPSNEDMDIIWRIINNLQQEDINRVYYKNNLYTFCDNTPAQKMIYLILKGLDKPFLDPNECPAEIELEINEFKNVLKEYVYYPHMYQDKIEKVAISFKRVSVLTDTDSSMISLDAWYRYVLAMVYNVDFKIKRQYVDEPSFIEDNEIHVVDEETFTDYNFFTDEFVEVKRAVKQDKIIPQDNLRYSIVNIMLYILSDLSKDYMRIYSKSYNSHDDKNCTLILKNEMLIKRILLQSVRKHYAYLLEMKEGHLIPQKSSMGITGMEMAKSTLQKSVRHRLKQILFENVMINDTINLRNVLVGLVEFEKEIYRSLQSGESTYYKPMTVKSIDSYKDPAKQQGLKAMRVYNDTRDEGTPALDLNERNSVFIIKVRINQVTIQPLKDTNPNIYQTLSTLLMEPEFAKGITAYAVPLDTPTPKWVLDFIDYYKIINDNIKTFPLDSIGLVGRAGNENVNHANILRII